MQQRIRNRNRLLLPRLFMTGLLLAFGLGCTAPAADGPKVEITVYKSPTCGCCEEWVKHLIKEGFDVTAHDRDDMDAIKAEHGVFRSLISCHTALVDGYVIEGHVPAGDIRRLLAERPQIHGLSAPGMPQKSPGMQAPGKKPEGYDVLSFDGNGRSQVFHRY